MKYVDLFSTREISIAIWTIVFLIYIIYLAFNKLNVRKATYELLSAIINKHLFVFIIITFSYSILWIYLVSGLSIWDWIYLKDVLLWVLLIGIPFCFNAIVSKDKNYFSDTIKNSLKIAVLIEFIVGTFTFNLSIELILVPLSTLLFLLYFVSKQNVTYKPAEKLLSFLISTIGLIVLFLAGRSAIQSYSELNFIELLITFSIPITMTIIFLPLSYSFALYSNYELLFKRLEFSLPDNKKRNKAIRRIILMCNFSLKKIELFSRNYLSMFYTSINESQIDQIFKHFKSQTKGNNIITGAITSVLFLLSSILISYGHINRTDLDNDPIIIGYALMLIAIIRLTIIVNNSLQIHNHFISFQLSVFYKWLWLFGSIYLVLQILNLYSTHFNY
ncbi:hypothetical protein FLK61_41475 [Paenalkalicoccus suaedae]|uniref:Uncharacterized protein n=1 Tax=Paenalkalicoccus suaedae TaxID=2592382 RepID=A0A859FJU0_9BACI|nr:hypothetical protein [Paenalkalicoccus suaedae]QKS73063.1 hypothetical protein FLK61_41475 [Paenalkalicoccus suaedae]